MPKICRENREIAHSLSREVSMTARLAIVLDDGTAHTLKVVATLSDRELLIEAAMRAMESAYRRARQQPAGPRAEFLKLDAATLWCRLLQLIPELHENACALATTHTVQ